MIQARCSQVYARNHAVRCVQRCRQSVCILQLWVTDIDENDLFSPLHAPSGHLDTAIEHFYDKLLHIQERLKTEPGKQMGAKRHQFVGDMNAWHVFDLIHFAKMVDFLNSVENEFNAEPFEVACTA